MQNGKRLILAAMASVIGSASASLGPSTKQAAEATDATDAFGNPLRGSALAEESGEAMAAYAARQNRKAERRSEYPSKAEIDAMPTEKRNYWLNRRFGSATRTLVGTATWDKANPSRQVRRQEARRAGRMPIGMYSETWFKKLKEAA